MSSIVLAAVVLASMLVVHLSLWWWLRRLARRAAGAALDRGRDQPRLRRWVTRGVADVLPPLALAIWTHGLYLATTLVLPPPGQAAWVDRSHVATGWVYRLAVAGALIWLLARIGRSVEAFLLARATRSQASWDDLLLPLAGTAARHALPLVGLMFVAPALTTAPAVAGMIGRGTSLLLVGLVAYLLIEVVDAAAAFVLAQHRIDVTDNLQARAVHTQVVVLKKVAVTVILVFTAASMLMVFESVRQFGASILASAGIAGIVVGFAAQRSIATLLAGFQIALTQPIRVDDVVIVEGEWGRIEDITLTYVVVRIWDQRRLVVPITYFIEQPFQNWTRSSAELLGTVFLYVDYSVPLDALRAELTRVLEASPHWDGRVNVLQVTDAKEHTLELRALASASDASIAWNLRCEVRERLIGFLQRHHPGSLPRLRATFDGELTTP